MDGFPSPEDAADLPLDEFALRVLALLAQEDSGRRIQIRGLINGSIWADHVGSGNRAAFLNLLQEAWDWLYTHGLISGGDPSQSTDTWWAFITRRGHAVLDNPNGKARLQAELRLDVDLHPKIAERVRNQFLLGEYELAAFAAMREVEIRVRELSGASESDIGVALMTAAFKDGGPLRDPSLDGGESEATMALFRGVIGVFKNPSSHRQVEFGDPSTASEVVLLADLLLRMLDGVEKRLTGQS